MPAADCRWRFYISGIPDTAEALIVRNDRNPSGGLAGKKIAVPFTLHGPLQPAGDNWRTLNVDEKSVQLINRWPAGNCRGMGREAILMRRMSGEPALSQLKANGRILISGRDVRAWGKPTYDLWVADSKFANTAS